MSESLKTLHVDTGSTWRGGQQQVLYLLAGLRERGHVADLVCQPASPLGERARAAGVGVLPVRMLAEADLIAVLRIARIMARGQYDIVHSHTSHAHVLTGIASWLTRHRPKRVVARRVLALPRHAFSRLKYRWWADRYIAVSEAVKRCLIEAGVREDQISVVNSSVDLGRFENVETGDIRGELGLPVDAVLIANVAYLVRPKAQRYLIEAMLEVLRAVPKAYCLLVGDGDQRANLEELTGRLGLTERVLFTGVRTDALRFIKGADVSVMSSQEDGLGNSVCETLALRRPLVATDAGGIPEVVENGVSGIIVPRCDSHALADGIIRMLSDPAAAARYAEAGRRVIEERFTVPTMVEKTVAVYRGLR